MKAPNGERESVNSLFKNLQTSVSKRVCQTNGEATLALA
jgi:hypothetical protein